MKCPACGNDVPDDSKFCQECSYSFTGAGQTGQLNPDTVLENRYIIVKTIGRGGMGAVYMALDQRLNNRSVAIKEMSTQAVGGDLQAAIGAFKKEASMLIGLEHPALPHIYDLFSKGEDHLTWSLPDRSAHVSLLSQWEIEVLRFIKRFRSYIRTPF